MQQHLVRVPDSTTGPRQQSSPTAQEVCPEDLSLKHVQQCLAIPASLGISHPYSAAWCCQWDLLGQWDLLTCCHSCCLAWPGPARAPAAGS
jgi:hypothetical protein